MERVTDIVKHFFTKVDKNGESGCWLWRGSIKSENGYGCFSVKRRNVYAHRWSYEYHKGPIPTGLHIDHLCFTRNCVNPDHLEAVTIRENLSRSPNPSTMNALKTHCVHGHAYTKENTRYTRGGSGRRCLTCDRKRNRERYQPHVDPAKLSVHRIENHVGPVEKCSICHRRYLQKHEENKISGLVSQERTHCRNGHPYNKENTYVYENCKYCRICRRERYRKYHKRPPKPTHLPKKGYTPAEWRGLKTKYNYMCLCCGRREPEIKLVADHVVPKSMGGPDSIDNRQPLCRSCNSKKRAKIIDFRP